MARQAQQVHGLSKGATSVSQSTGSDEARAELLERVDVVARAEHRTRSNLLQRAALLYVEHAESGAEDREPKAMA